MSVYSDPIRERNTSLPVMKLQAVLDAAAQSKDKAFVEEAVSAKVAVAATAAPGLEEAVSVLKNGGDDPVQLAADALQLGAETLASKTAAAAPLSGSSQLLSGLKKAADGDAAGATLAMAVAGEKLTTRFSGGFGALAGVLALAVNKERLKEQLAETPEKLKAIVSPSAHSPSRVDSALDAGLHLRELALVGHSLVHAGIKVLKNGVRLLGRLSLFASTAKSLSSVGQGLASTPIGSAMSTVNRWLPALNVAGVFLSGKAVLDVFRDGRATGRTKALAVGSLVTSGLALWVGFSAAVIPLLAVVGVSIALDFALSASRKRDHADNAKTGSNEPPLAGRTLTAARHFGVA